MKSHFELLQAAQTESTLATLQLAESTRVMDESRGRMNRAQEALRIARGHVEQRFDVLQKRLGESESD